ncbi:MAG: NAD-dependent DNA ligase LigA [Helicobacter sp.]|nr:NAD-dependent DNA ligase LigA [Helicobacter sp.]
MDYADYKEKVSLLNTFAHAYYVLDAPLISDFEYDLLYKEVLDYENSHKSSILPFSPTQKVGGDAIDSLVKVAHKTRMWSLDNAFGSEDMANFYTRMQSELTSDLAFVCSPKLDGLSLNLCYENGLLIQASTRGNGHIGEQVLHNAKTIKNIPLVIPHSGLIEIRGEVVIYKDDFIKINEELSKRGENTFSNPRNAAAGSLRQLDPKIALERKLRFIPWGFGIGGNELGDSLFDALLKIIDFGFQKPDFLAICKNIDEIQEHFNALNEAKDGLKTQLDGMVVMLDSFALQNELGWTIKSPRFGFAYKFDAITRTTRLLDVIPQIGRSGTITPVGLLDPIEIEGAKISRASLHNYKEIARKGIYINDIVEIIRSGDVIPKILAPLVHLRDDAHKIKEIIPPEFCPFCNHELKSDDTFIRCINELCDAKIKKQIAYFASKDGLNIDGLGEKVVERLYDAGLLRGVSDLYKLTKEDILKLDGFKDKSAENVINSIQKTINCELSSFINALGITHIGKGASQKIAKNLGLELFNKTSSEVAAELEALDSFGGQMKVSFIAFLEQNKDLINELLDLIKPVQSQNTQNVSKDSIFYNKNIVLTGSLKRARNIIKSRLEALGANIRSSVSSKIDLLIYGDSPGSKLEAAKSLGITCINEEEFEKMLSKI